MALGGADGSGYSVHFWGRTGLGDTYVGVGMKLTDNGQPYDLSCCKGISFKAKRGHDSVDTVRVKLGDAQTQPEGGFCKECTNDFGMGLSYTEEWKEYTVPFDRMTQEPNWGTQVKAIDSSRIYKIEWQISYPNFDVDVFIDDVRLVGCTKAN